MFKKSRIIALLMVCMMFFSVVQPSFAEYRTGSAGGDAAAYGVGGGSLAAIGAAAVLTFFTGGAALPWVLGAGALGAAGGGYYGYTEEDKTLEKDLKAAGLATVGGAAVGGVAVAAAALGAGTTATGGTALVGKGIEEANKKNSSNTSPVYSYSSGSSSTPTTSPRLSSSSYSQPSVKSTTTLSYIGGRLRTLTR